MRQLQSTLRATSLLTAVASLAGAQGRPTVNQPGRAVPLTAARSDAALPPDSVLVRSLAFRSIGPAVMSGRISDIAVVVDPKAPRARVGTVIYVAAATGGVWKTSNGGVNWAPVFDSVRTGSVGAIAVAPSDPSVVWVGTGEANNMRSSSWGTGVYKSTDAGKTWSAAMLPTSQHVGKIVIDPRDANVVYVAAVGPLWAPGGERGLFKTTDGGKSWTNLKEISKYTGFTEIAMDPSNPDVLYAASLERERREYGFLPAGPETGIFKTTDAGRTWTQLKDGLPTGDLGRIGLSVCKSKPTTVYATIHAKPPAAGLYRSEDGGATWKQMNDQDGTAWYYSQVRCDPANPDHVIQLNAQSRESKDAGKTLTPFAAGGVHSDHHALWISDDDPEHMILGGDGGVYTTYDAGRTWDHNESIVAGQFYAIAVDDAQPFYNVYGGLQDNQTWGGPSRTRTTFGPTNADWFRMAGGDGFYAVPDPLDNNLVYAESQTGGVVRYDARTGQTKNIRPAPKPGERFRFNWSAPILPSKHDVKSVFMAAQFLFRSTDRGDSWEKISPDLTRGIDRNKLPMRGSVPDSAAPPLGRNEGTAEFSNISTIDQSPLKKDLLAVGTDDGLIQVTRDGGKTWTKTDKFPDVPETTFVSRVVWSSAAEGTIYATLDGHRSNDFRPYVVKSTDFGATWTSITSNLPDGGSAQVIREHPRQPNLLFVGTEFGAYFTIDGGAHWTQLKSGIPGVPVHDMQIQSRANDLVVGTHGRGIFILDDLSPLENLAQAKQATVAYLFPVHDALLFQPNGSRSSGMGSRGFSGQNPEPGPHIDYTISDVPPSAKVSLTILDQSGAPVRALPVTRQPGLYRSSWDMRVGPPLTGPVDTLALANAGRGGAGGRGGRGGFGGGAGAAPAGGAADSAGRGGRGGPGGGGAADSTGRGGGGGGGFGGGRGGADGTFPALPGRYVARLSVTPAEGAATILDQPFALTKDPMVILSDNELKQLYAFRLGVVKLQRDLRERQAQLDTAERTLAAAKRAADSAGTKVSPELKTQIAAVEKELADITREMGAAAGGRGGAGRGGPGGGGGGALAAGGAGGGRGGRGGGRGAGGASAAPQQAGATSTAAAAAPSSAAGPAGGAASDQDQNPTGPVAPENIQARLGTTTELLNSTFNPNPEQKRLLTTLPADLQKQGDRVKKVSTDQLPALLKALKDAGVDVKTP